MKDYQPGSRRRRGAVLTSAGIQRLQQAIKKMEAAEHNFQRLTIDELSARAGISNSTMSRIWSGNAGVDQKSLRLLFSAFNLQLTDADFRKVDQLPRVQIFEPFSPFNKSCQPLTQYPSGPVKLGASFYVNRPPLEAQACEEITHPGCLLRIKGPAGFGRSSLLLRVIDYAERLGYATATVDLRQAEPTTLQNPGIFLQWLCIAFSLELGFEPKLDDYWSDEIGKLLSTTMYMREHLLAQLKRPLVLNIQELDQLFSCTSTAQAFFPLLRSWHEETRHQAAWHHLRIVVSYSTESYLNLDINQSPFNVGLPLKLPAFTKEQVAILAERYSLELADADLDRLMQLLGGLPALTRIALYHLSRQDLSVDELLQFAPLPGGIYQSHLQKMSAAIQEKSQLLECLRKLLEQRKDTWIEPALAYQMEGIGLIKAAKRGWEMSCDLYRVYCQNYLLN